MKRLSTVSEESATFQYGFLTSRTSTILSRCINTKDFTLDEESLSALNRANGFIEDVLNGERLVSGEKGGLSPSIDGLRVFNYAVDSLSALQSLNYIQPLSNREDIKKIFYSIHKIVTDLTKKPIGVIQPEKLDLAHNSFSVLADALVKEVPAFFEPEPVSFPGQQNQCRGLQGN